MWNNKKLRNISFDIMIDDGLHEKTSSFNFFIQSYFKLKINGYYIIEDIVISELVSYEKALDKLKDIFNFEFEIKNIFHDVNKSDNALAIIVKK